MHPTSVDRASRRRSVAFGRRWISPRARPRGAGVLGALALAVLAVPPIHGTVAAGYLAVLRAPFSGSWTPSQSTSVGSCGGSASIPVTPTANLSLGSVTMRVRASSNCTALAHGGDDFARGRVRLTIADWTANASGRAIVNVTLRLDFHVQLNATRSTTACSWPSSAFGELEIDTVYATDLNTSLSYWATSVNGFTNSTWIVGTANYSALDHILTGFQIPMGISVHHRYDVSIAITATVETTSCGPGGSSSAILDAARFGHAIRIVAVRY